MTLLALLLNRFLATALPFRVRPIYTDGLPFHPMSVDAKYSLEDWSSFPSDNATYFFGLATGIWYLNRWLAVYLWFHALTVVCLSRVYMGIHFPSDVLVGAVIGLAVLLPARSPWLHRLLRCQTILALTGRFPALFGLMAGLLTFEMISAFEDGRAILRGPVRMLRHEMPAHTGAILVVTALVLLAGAGAYLVIRRNAASAKRFVRS
jgi:undecaprenyl-diphosphatase